MTDFYEDDEPVERVREQFARGEKGVTKRPRDLNRRASSIVRDATERQGDPANPITFVADWAPSMVVEHLRFGGQGASAFVLSPATSVTIEAVTVASSS